ncbi:MAG: carboxypeptidase-like regulatory domain-containing protein [Bacteroidales bacterium]|nr:carboxypeptidase-like regulatory domain-containing protein [Bacteroidales bacterium]
MIPKFKSRHAGLPVWLAAVSELIVSRKHRFHDVPQTNLKDVQQLLAFAENYDKQDKYFARYIILFLSKTFKLILLSLFLIFHPVLWGQNEKIEITGIVIDSNSTQPIKNVNIFSKRNNVGTISDKDGHFTIHLQIFPDTIQFSHGESVIKQEILLFQNLLTAPL